MPKRNQNSLEGYTDSPTAWADHIGRFHKDDLGHFVVSSNAEMRRVHQNIHVWGDPGHTHEG